MKTINVRTVRQYVEVTAAIAKLTATRERLRIQLIRELRNGATCSETGPFLLYLKEEQRQAIAWKRVALALARKLKAQRLLDCLVEKYPVNQVPVLLTKVNPDWIGV